MARQQVNAVGRRQPLKRGGSAARGFNAWFWGEAPAIVYSLVTRQSARPEVTGVEYV